MKILIVSHEYPPVGGGGANACMNLAKEYCKQGNEVHVVTAWYPGEKYNEVTPEGVNIYRIFYVKPFHLRTSYRKKNGLISVKSFLEYQVDL